jgi:hypothetical protein
MADLMDQQMIALLNSSLNAPLYDDFAMDGFALSHSCFYMSAPWPMYNQEMQNTAAPSPMYNQGMQGVFVPPLMYSQERQEEIAPWSMYNQDLDDVFAPSHMYSQGMDGVFAPSSMYNQEMQEVFAPLPMYSQELPEVAAPRMPEMHFFPLPEHPVVLDPHEELRKKLEYLDDLTEKQASIVGRMMINREKIAIMGRKANRIDRANGVKPPKPMPKKLEFRFVDMNPVVEEDADGELELDLDDEWGGDDEEEEEDEEGQAGRDRVGNGFPRFCKKIAAEVEVLNGTVERWGRRIERNEARIRWIEEELERRDRAEEEKLRRAELEVCVLLLGMVRVLCHMDLLTNIFSTSGCEGERKEARQKIVVIAEDEDEDEAWH